MNNIRIVLTTEHRLQSQLLRHTLKSHAGFELVGETTDHLQTMAMLAQTKPDVWMHSWPEGPQLQAVLSHLESLLPDLTVVRVSPDDSTGYLQRPVHSLSQLLGLLNSTIRGPSLHQVS